MFYYCEEASRPGKLLWKHFIGIYLTFQRFSWLSSCWTARWHTGNHDCREAAESSIFFSKGRSETAKITPSDTYSNNLYKTEWLILFTEYWSDAILLWIIYIYLFLFCFIIHTLLIVTPLDMLHYVMVNLTCCYEVLGV